LEKTHSELCEQLIEKRRELECAEEHNAKLRKHRIRWVVEIHDSKYEVHKFIKRHDLCETLIDTYQYLEDHPHIVEGSIYISLHNLGEVNHNFRMFRLFLTGKFPKLAFVKGDGHGPAWEIRTDIDKIKKHILTYLRSKPYYKKLLDNYLYG
jgi:hypothetical protein